MLEFNELRSLMLATAKAKPQANTTYSFNGENLTYNAMSTTLRAELNELVGTDALWRDNKNKVFTLLEETLDAVVPALVLERYGDFAEIRTVAQGDKPVFKRRLGRERAKQFVTRVGQAGVYEVFKLGEERFTVETSAIGGAVQIGFEEFLDGRVDFNELLEIMMEGMDAIVYLEIAKALNASVNSVQSTNKKTGTTFEESKMDALVSIVSAYGTPVIYCTREFAATMVPATGWVSENMRNDMWNKGYLANYKGTQVIILPQSFTDNTNEHKVMAAENAWIVPAGTAGKPVKVVFEGTAHIREEQNHDWSRDLHTYQKVGVGVMMTPNIAVYTNESLMAEAAQG